MNMCRYEFQLIFFPSTKYKKFRQILDLDNKVISIKMSKKIISNIIGK